MARGYPDFFGQPIFPGYGTGSIELHAGIAVTPLTVGDVVNLIAKGRVVGCEISAVTSVNFIQQIVRLYIDGVLAGSVPDGAGSGPRWLGFYRGPISPTHLNISAGLWRWKVETDTTFNTEFRLQGANNDLLTDLLISVRLFYNNVA